MKLFVAVQAFVDMGVEFIVIGGWSAVLHGSSYITNDLDVCFRRTRENCKRVAEALRPYHPRLRDVPDNLPFVWDAATLANGSIFTLKTDLGMVDLLTEIDGIGTFEDALKLSVKVPAFDREVWTLDLPALIRSKRAAGRPKDLQLIPELEGLLDATNDSSGSSGK
ncbi:MAG: hypothetical protein ABL995_07865 [Bryobacteraceae bacterium]